MGKISQAYILSKVKEYLTTEEGKALVKQYKKDVFNKKEAPCDNKLITETWLNNVVKDVKDMLFYAVSGVIHSFGNNKNDISIEINSEDIDNITVDININEDVLHRASLHYLDQGVYNDTGRLTVAHGEGIDDIISLFVHGYTLKSAPPRGVWVHSDGRRETYIRARAHRDPNPFMSDLETQINEKYKGRLKASLSDEYKK